MAVASTTRFTPSSVGVSYDQFQQIEQQISALQQSITTATDSYSADAANPSLSATDASQVLPTSDDGSGTSSGVDQSSTYGTWQGTLQQLATADFPAFAERISAHAALAGRKLA